jgi:hypothetical protein
MAIMTKVVAQVKIMPQFYTEKTGKFIDTWIRLRRRIDKYQKSVTDYVNYELAEKSDLSGRQIERMRRCDGFPEDKSMNKLINAIPDLASLNCIDFTDRLLLPFDIVLQAQDRIKIQYKENLNTIVIISGWIQPLGIQQKIIAEAITKNINQGFKYIFLYPTTQTYPKEINLLGNHSEKECSNAIKEITEDWINTLRTRCSSIHFNNVINTTNKKEEIDKELMKFRDLADKNIIRNHSQERNSDFWFSLPSNYTVLYNPDKPQESDFSRYGMFNVYGKTVEFSDKVLREEGIDESFQNRSEGWLYIDDEKFEELARMYLELKT